LGDSPRVNEGVHRHRHRGEGANQDDVVQVGPEDDLGLAGILGAIVDDRLQSEGEEERAQRVSLLDTRGGKDGNGVPHHEQLCWRSISEAKVRAEFGEVGLELSPDEISANLVEGVFEVQLNSVPVGV